MVAAVSYAERIRHPSGALSDQDEKWGFWVWMILLVIGAVILVYAWRRGWFGNPMVLPPLPLANPLGWV